MHETYIHLIITSLQSSPSSAQDLRATDLMTLDILFLFGGLTNALSLCQCKNFVEGGRNLTPNYLFQKQYSRQSNPTSSLCFQPHFL